MCSMTQYMSFYHGVFCILRIIRFPHTDKRAVQMVVWGRNTSQAHKVLLQWQWMKKLYMDSDILWRSVSTHRNSLTQSVYSVYCTNQMHSIKCIWLLKTQFLHVSVQVYHLQGAQWFGILLVVIYGTLQTDTRSTWDLDTLYRPEHIVPQTTSDNNNNFTLCQLYLTT
jgi:hypothetical protein